MGRKNRGNGIKRKSFAVMLLVLVLTDEAEASSCGDDTDRCDDIGAYYLQDYSYNNWLTDEASVWGEEHYVDVDSISGAKEITFNVNSISDLFNCDSCYGYVGEIYGDSIAANVDYC